MIKGKSMVVIIALLIAGMYLLSRLVHTRTAFTALMALVVVVSFFMVVEAVSFIGGIVITVFAALAILALDEAGILA